MNAKRIMMIIITASFGLTVQAQESLPPDVPADPVVEPEPVSTEPIEVSVTQEDLVAIEPELLDEGVVEGGLISLNVRGVELRNIIRIFTELSGANIIIPELAPELAEAKIDVNLSNVQWRPALQAVLSTLELELYEQIPGTEVYSVRRRSPPEEAPRFTRVFVFNHADIGQATQMIQGLVGERGEVFAHSQGNSVVVKTSQEIMDDVAQVAERIDKPRQQVMIEARIMELSDEGTRARGADFTWRNILSGQQHLDDSVPPHGRLFFNALTGLTRDNFPFDEGLGTLTLDSHNFHIAMSALYQSGKARIVSNPRVIVANGETAEIQIIQKIPRLMISRTSEQLEGQAAPVTTYTVDQDDDGLDPNTNRRRYTEYEFGIRLAVTPTVYTEDNIAVNIVPIITRRSPQEDIVIVVDQLRNTFFAVEEKRVETTFMLGNERTAVIGGLTETNDLEYERKVPILGHIPLIRHLFTYSESRSIQTENIIFVTVSLEDGQRFDMDKAVAQSPLTRKQMLRDESNQRIEDRELELFAEQEERRIAEETLILDRRHQVDAYDRSIRRPFWKVLRPGSRPRP